MKNIELNLRKTIARASCMGLVSVIALHATPSFAQKYTVTRLNNLPGVKSYAYGDASTASGINNAGQVVGTAYDANFGENVVIWNGAVPTIVYAGTSADLTEGFAINNLGQVTGLSIKEGALKLFVWSPTFFNDELGVAPGNEGEIYAINDSGKMVGYVTESYVPKPAVWVNTSVVGGPTLLLSMPSTVNNCGGIANGINSTGDIVGYSYECSTDNTHALRWNADGTVTDLGTLDAAASASAALSINASGYVAGAETINNKTSAVVWGPHTRGYDLDNLGGLSSYANSINAEGDVVGSVQTKYNGSHAVIWTHKHFKAIDLNSEIGPSLAAQITLTNAVGTNDKCKILASGIENSSGNNEFFVLSLTDQSDCNE